MTCLQDAFPRNWPTAANVARTLGYEITPTPGSLPWVYVPHEAIGEINKTLARWEQGHSDSTTINNDWVSTRIINSRLNYRAEFFAKLYEIEVRERVSPEHECWVRVDDLPLIASAARQSTLQGDGWITDPAAIDNLIAWIRENDIAGITDRDFRRRERAEREGRIFDDRPHWPRGIF
jgi:hypothetical protein